MLSFIKIIIHRFALIFFILSVSSVLAEERNKLNRLSLAKPVSNNAVAISEISNQTILFSFNGLGGEKTIKDIHNNSYSVNLTTKISKQISSVPGNGKLASIAVTLNNRILVIGGYTVAADHSEVSTAEIYEYFPLKDRFQIMTKMPVPVDDTVALVYQQRYLYLVSGWHDTGNVSLVQVYDIKEDRWFEATPFPGAPVFGHAGGIVNDKFLIADGVKINAIVDGKREYAPSNENWLGKINSSDPAIIDWFKIKKHPFKPLYRMASVGDEKRNAVIFVGGSDNPYNYNGIGYNGEPSEPSSAVFSFDLKKLEWNVYKKLDYPTMDHRGLLINGDKLYVLGGMGKNQKVLDRISTIKLPKADNLK